MAMLKFDFYFNPSVALRVPAAPYWVSVFFVIKPLCPSDISPVRGDASTVCVFLSFIHNAGIEGSRLFGKL
jgi:hypothetical protein